MSPKTKLFLILWLAGMAGVLSSLLVDFSAMLAIMPLPAGTQALEFTPLLRFLSLLQPAVLLSIAVLLGVVLAPKVGLSSPAAEAAIRGGQISSALKPQILPGILGGLAGGVSIVLVSLLGKPFLPVELLARISSLGNLVPLPTRMLYGGFTEELLLRWGFMTLLAWAAWRIFQKGQGKPRRAVFVASIFISAIVFAIGHLPIAILLAGQPTIALVSFVIAGNSVFGLVAGFLYWKKGLESAMLAHALAHVVLLAAHFLGAYF